PASSGRRAAPPIRRSRRRPTRTSSTNGWRASSATPSLPSTAFVRQVNRATAETAQQSALAEGLAPLMGWVKRLVDHVIQDRMGHRDLEFAWIDPRPADPSEQAKLLDTYVRSGIYTVNEARDLLGFDPVAGGDRAMVFGGDGPVLLQSIVT